MQIYYMFQEKNPEKTLFSGFDFLKLIMLILK